MFRRLEGSLPQDPRFKADMEALGYSINDKSQIRQIKNPNSRFHFFITNNKRTNIMHREAMHACIRHEVARRSLALGMSVLYLPHMKATDPKVPSVPILCTPLRELKEKKRVVVVVNGSGQDLGLWAYRTIFSDGIEAGSCVSLIKELDSSTGLIVCNSGQLMYSWKFNQPMTTASWEALPRESAVHPRVQDNMHHNRVAGNHDAGAHFEFVLNRVVMDSEYVDPRAEVYIMGIEQSGDAALKVLDVGWNTYSSRITAIALTEPFWRPLDTASTNFATFLATRARAWRVDTTRARNACAAIPPYCKDSTAETQLAELSLNDEADGTEVSNTVFADVAMPTFAAGPDNEFATDMECVFVETWKDMLQWFDEVYAAGPSYENPRFEVAEPLPELEPEPEVEEVQESKMIEGVKQLQIEDEADGKPAMSAHRQSSRKRMPAVADVEEELREVDTFGQPGPLSSLRSSGIADACKARFEDADVDAGADAEDEHLLTKVHCPTDRDITEQRLILESIEQEKKAKDGNQKVIDEMKGAEASELNLAAGEKADEADFLWDGSDDDRYGEEFDDEDAFEAEAEAELDKAKENVAPLGSGAVAEDQAKEENVVVAGVKVSKDLAKSTGLL